MQQTSVATIESDRAVDLRAAEAAAVSAGWQLVDIFERLGTPEVSRLLKDWLEDEAARARDELQPLEHWSSCGPKSLRTYQSPANSSRFRRTLDFIGTDDRIFDIGLGVGYQPATIVVQGKPAAYHGMDIGASNVKATMGAFEANGVSGPNFTLEQGDLFALTRADLERVDANLLICCEVLEHVRDPELALCTLANALPDGAELLFSVPLGGRLQGVWSHVTNFDAARLHPMVEAARLHAHLVEPLHNTWALVLASRSPEPSPRAMRAAAARPPRPLTATAVHRDFHPIDVTVDNATAIAPAGASVTVAKAASRGITISVTAEPAPLRRRLLGRRRPTLAAGISLPVEGLYSARLEVAVDGAAGLKRVTVEGLRDKTRCVSWGWDSADRSEGADPRTFLLQSNKQGKAFVSISRPNPSAAAMMQVLAHLRPGGTVTFRLLRASYMP